MKDRALLASPWGAVAPLQLDFAPPAGVNPPSTPGCPQPRCNTLAQLANHGKSRPSGVSDRSRILGPGAWHFWPRIERSHRPLAMMQGQGSNDAGSPQKGPQKIFRASREIPIHGKRFPCHPRWVCGSFSRAPTRRSTVAARCAIGGPGAEPLAFGNFWEFGALSATENLICGHCAPSARDSASALGADVGHA